jgi:hypothetical protein
MPAPLQGKSLAVLVGRIAWKIESYSGECPR